MSVLLYSKNYISSIEGSILSNFSYITTSAKTKKCIKNLTKNYFNLELSLFQFLCIGSIIFLSDICLIYLVLSLIEREYLK